ncbi:hypothetical protein FZEAL_1206 [Fusarium zealandicum]|uniref:Uncharacterized protein n=1 Tax=Fusarium zealandicum TaxID=1053134 RepID=A0A8H4UT62_9HYPO|nr:hypothetical protein FZEAL_1206 [Fusarium zealandicum]
MAQRTFTLIPQFPGRDQTPDRPTIRPMTSKQAQKAYKAANKGPRLSRAEAWKQEKAEQERIRKEFEKEKSAAKAKVAREKKKEKELAEKEQKRKKGLPLVSVRPSQDTIARFVRGNGTAKKRDAEGRGVNKTDAKDDLHEDVTEATSEALIEDEQHEPSPKRPRLEKIQEADEETPKIEGEAVIEYEPQRQTPNTRSLENIQETEEDTVEAAEAPVIENGIGNNPPTPPRLLSDMDEDELDADFEEDLALEMLEDLEAAVDKESYQTPIRVVSTLDTRPIPKTAASNQPTGRPANRYEEDLGLNRPTPSTFSALQASLPKQPQYTPASPSPSPPRQAPPMSTQAILCNFDDFFPSSSQQARELEEDIGDDFLSSAPMHLPAITEIDEAELDEAPQEPVKPAPLPTLEPPPESPSPPPRRFFTSSGSHEAMSLALHRSRRTAALEKIQQRERSRIQAGILARTEADSRRPHEPAKPQKSATNPVQKETGGYKPKQPPARTPSALREKQNIPMAAPNPPVTAKQPLRAEPCAVGPNKENQHPPDQPLEPSASQESYGGEWVDEIALELMI